MSPIPRDELDQTAAVAVQNGDREAFAVIVEAYRRPLFRIALRYLGSSAAAEDALQDIFVKAYRLIGNYDPERPFSPWLYRLASNLLKSKQKSSARRGETVQEEIDEPTVDTSGVSSDDPADLAARSWEIQEVRAAVDSLAPRLREVVMLYYLGESTVEETAKALGIGRENVKSRLHRARKALRRSLSGI